MYAVVTYANMQGVRAVDRIVELCERYLAFIWLTNGKKLKEMLFMISLAKNLQAKFLMTFIFSLYAVWKKKVLLH